MNLTYTFVCLVLVLAGSSNAAPAYAFRPNWAEDLTDQAEIQRLPFQLTIDSKMPIFLPMFYSRQDYSVGFLVNEGAEVFSDSENKWLSVVGSRGSIPAGASPRWVSGEQAVRVSANLDRIEGELKKTKSSGKLVVRLVISSYVLNKGQSALIPHESIRSMPFEVTLERGKVASVRNLGIWRRSTQGQRKIFDELQYPLWKFMRSEDR